MNEYAPEKVAELVAEWDKGRIQGLHPWKNGQAIRDALTAVSAELATVEKFLASYKAATKRAEADRDRLHKAITESLAEEERRTDQGTRMWRILRAALEN